MSLSLRGARSALTTLAFSFAACVAELPPAASADELRGCAPGSFGALGPDACARDRDCVVCRDGSACGSPLSRRHAEASGAACAVPRDEGLVCDASAVACCQHRCVLLLGPPAFGRGTEDTSGLPRE